MYCQQCGAQLRQTARFCNKCGVKVRQRFSGVEPPPRSESAPEAGKLPALAGSDQPAPQAWAPIEQTLIMPVVGQPMLGAPPSEPPGEPEEKRLAAAAQAERPTVFEPPAPAPPKAHAEASPPAPRRWSTAAWRRDAARKPVFTQVMPAASNRQHNRLMIVVPFLLLIFIGVLVLAYVAAK